MNGCGKNRITINEVLVKQDNWNNEQIEVSSKLFKREKISYKINKQLFPKVAISSDAWIPTDRCDYYILLCKKFCLYVFVSEEKV